MIQRFDTPFPRPRYTWKSVFWVFLVGVLCSAFILVFKPFNIENTSGALLQYFHLFSLGLVFSFSICVWEFGIPSLWPRAFDKWTLARAISWYSLMMLFVGALMFLYKSYLGGFTDFTFKEYLLVCGRVFLIGTTVSFFVLGLVNYVRKSGISSIASHQSGLIKTPDGKVIHLYFEDVLYMESDQNYVDIFFLKDGARTAQTIRSSLKNVEDQVVFALSPMYRCHRKYLINLQSFEILRSNSRSMVIRSKDGETTIPVSKRYVGKIRRLLEPAADIGTAA